MRCTERCCGFDSRALRWKHFGSLRKIPLLAVHCLHMPCFLVHVGSQVSWGFPPYAARICPLPPCTMTHLMTLCVAGSEKRWVLVSNSHFVVKKGRDCTTLLGGIQMRFCSAIAVRNVAYILSAYITRNNSIGSPTTFDSLPSIMVIQSLPS